MLETKGGAFVILRRVIFWKACILFIFDFFADPHSWIPYVHMGFRRDLYIWSLVFNDEHLFFESSTFRERERALSSNLFFLIWFCQVSLLSRFSPKYLTVSREGIGRLFTVTLGQSPCLRVNVVWVDLLLFNLIFHLVYHSESTFKWDCKFLEAINGSLCTDNMTLSSA